MNSSQNYEFSLVCKKNKDGSPKKNAKWILHFKWQDKSKSAGYYHKEYTLNKKNCGVDFWVKSKNTKDLDKEKSRLQSNSNYISAVANVFKIFEKDNLIINKNITLLNCANSWLNNKNDINEKTRSRYKNIIDVNIKGFFGDKKKIKDVTSYDLEAFHAELYKQDKAKGTVKIIIGLTKSIFWWAFSPKQKIIVENPFEACEFQIPYSKKHENPIHDFLRPDEVNEVYRIFEGHYLYSMIKISILTGLRRGELLGLRWQDINFEKKIINVSFQLSENEGKLVFSNNLKSSSAIREIPINDELIAIFESLKADQFKNKLFFGNDYYDCEHDLVFLHKDGKPYIPRSVTQAFSNKLKKNNFRHLKWHDLRHTFCSILANTKINGVPKYDISRIQYYMGHGSYSTTADIYNHVLIKDDCPADDIERQYQAA